MAFDHYSRTKKSYLSRFFRTRLLMIIFFMFMTVCSIAILTFVTDKHEDEQNHIVNILGRQRMLTQKIAKDANRLSAIYQAFDSDERVKSKAELNKRALYTKEGLREAAEQFDNTLTQARNGKIHFDRRTITLYDPHENGFDSLLSDTDKKWTLFYSNVQTILGRESFDQEFRLALIHINEENENLLSLTEELMTLTLDKFHRENRRTRTVLMLLILFLVLFSIWGLVGTYRLIVIPYNTFYKGIQSLGADDGLSKIGKNDKNSLLMKEVSETFFILREMVSIMANIHQGSSFNETLHIIFNTFKPHIPYNYIGIATFVGYSGNLITASYGESDGTFKGLPQRLLDQSVEIEKTSLKKLLETNTPRVINDLEKYAESRNIQKYTQIVLEEGVRSSITMPLTVNGKGLGFLFFSSKEKNIYTDMHVNFLRNISNAVALSFEKDIFVDELVYSSVLALAKMAEARDEDTAEHLDRMQQYTLLLARSMKEDGLHSDILTPEFIRGLERFSPMHDIGKVGIRDNVLLKPGRLDKEEWDHMRTHTTYGANVLLEAENNIARSGRTLFQAGIRIAQSHHEWWDGSGYPFGLVGTEIPLEARIVTIADVLDALTTRRPYKEPFAFEKSFEMMTGERGTHFDPEIIDVFIKYRSKFEALYDEFRSTQTESY